jgi:CubicO group peptidase (beta-lactamase class C family)
VLTPTPRAIATGLLLCVATGAAAQAPPASADLKDHPRVAEALHLLDVWLDANRAYERIPGISAGIVHDQELIWAKGFGYAHRETNEPATPATLYSICSITKLFTSIGVMQLRDAGRVRLDDPVPEHIAGFMLRGEDPNAPPVTVRGLITHASGLPREPDVPYWSETEFRFPTREQVLKQVPAQEMLYAPYTRHQYSNLGMIVAGELIQAVSGLEWGAYVEQKILRPLGMTDTYTEMPVQHRGGQLASGYGARRREGERALLDFFEVGGLRPAFGFASTVQDLARFASWQFATLSHKRSDVLAPNTLKEMQRVHWMDPDGGTTWGLGFTVTHSDGKRFVGHGGNCPGYQTQLLMQPDEQIATIVFANALGANTGRLARTAYDIVAPAVRQALSQKTAPEPPDADLSRYLGTYTSPLGGETHVMVWEGQLASVSLPSQDPVGSITKLRRERDNVFRPVRADDTLGEPWLFEMDPDGTASRLKRHQNYSYRQR